MQHLRRTSLLLAACLSALAGYVDALGFLHLGGSFVSFMSGNSTRLAVELAAGNWSSVAMLVALIGSFVSGSMAGALIGHLAGSRRRAAVLVTVALLLMSAATLATCGLPAVAMIAIAFAMGTENAIFERDGNVIGLTYMTGTLVKIGHKLAASILRLEKRAWLPPLLLWLGLICGGVAGAVTYTRIGLQGLWLGALLAACLAVVSLQHQHDVEKRF